MLEVIAFAVIGATTAESGPGVAETATAVDLPIARVMVFSDRAHVTRSGKITWGTGIKALRIPDLPGAVMPGSLRVTTSGAKVVRVETQPVDRERWSIDQVDAWLADLEKENDKIASANRKLQAARETLAFLSGLHAAEPVPEKDRKAAPVVAPESWRSVQDWIGKRRSSARSTESAIERELRNLHKEFSRIQREVQKRELGAFTDRKLEVLVIVDGEQNAGELSVEYAVPGALWKPAYELYFDPDAGKVELLASGLVSQATGEDWQRVKMSLSTAIPSLGIAMPELATWTLGDDREWIPRPSAKNPPRRAGSFAPPARKPRVAELEREADRSLLASRISLLTSMAGRPPTSTPTTGAAHGRRAAPKTIDFSDDVIEGELLQPESVSEPYPAVPAPPPPPPPMDMPSSAPRLSVFDEGRVSTRRERTGRTQSLALFQGQGWAPAHIGDPMLPAASAGGFDYVYESPVVTSVPSQAEQLRVPLASRSYDVTTFYEATPALAKTAYLKATVKNGSKLPILAGPANVFVNRTFSGDAILATTGPGGTLELPLGADENIRLTHTVIPSTKSQGFLIGEEDVTDYAVKIDVGNYKKKAVTLRVIDQIPKTNEEKVKVELIGATPKAQKAPDADGLLHWHVDIPAGGTKQITFTYRVTRPKGWRLAQ